MAKKFVRGVTGVKDIENFDISFTNVNDIISDGQHTYIHTKTGESESYYNLTNNLNGISSSNNDLIEVTNNNNTTTLNPKHDAQKEQVLDSTRDTVTINRGRNGTTEKTTVDTNPEKVLEHDNLLAGYGIEKTFSDGTTKLELAPTRVSDFDVNTYFKGKVTGSDLTNAPTTGWYVYENDHMIIMNNPFIIQTATRLKLGDVQHNEKYMRVCDNGVWGEWIKQVTDEVKPKYDNLLAGYGIEKTLSDGTTKLELTPTRVSNFDVNTYFKGKVIGPNLTNSPTTTETGAWFLYENDHTTISNKPFIIQTATRLKLGDVDHNEKYMRVCDNGVWGEWIKQVTDAEPLDKYPLALELFENIAVIGDSYSSGELYPSTGAHDYYNISWIQLLARKHGLNATNYSCGGLKANDWLTNEHGLLKMNSDTPKDLYFIYLGINDNIDLSQGRIQLGSVSDIGTDNDTFYGNYSKIINHVKTKAPHGKIAIVNVQNPSVNQLYEHINTIAEHFSLPVLDLSKDSLTNSSDYSNEMHEGHPQALGYATLAGAIERLLKKSFNDKKSYWIDYIPQSTE